MDDPKNSVEWYDLAENPGLAVNSFQSRPSGEAQTSLYMTSAVDEDERRLVMFFEE
jgi:hypothetical protein